MSTINLLPKDYLKQRTQRRVNKVCMILFGVVISSVVGAYIVSSRSYAHTREIRDRVNAEYAEATRLIYQMHTLEKQKLVLSASAEVTASLVERVPRSTILAIITNARPKGTSLTQIELETHRSENDEPNGRMSPSGKSILSTQSRSQTQKDSLITDITVTGLTGTDASVAKFIANLVRNELVDSVDLSFSQEKLIDHDAIREFQIKFRLKQGVDAIDVTGKISASSTVDDGKDCSASI